MAEVILLAAIGQGTAGSDSIVGSLAYSTSGEAAARRGRSLLLLLLLAVDRGVRNGRTFPGRILCDQEEILRAYYRSMCQQILGADEAVRLAPGYGDPIRIYAPVSGEADRVADPATSASAHGGAVGLYADPAPSAAAEGCDLLIPGTATAGDEDEVEDEDIISFNPAPSAAAKGGDGGHGADPDPTAPAATGPGEGDYRGLQAIHLLDFLSSEETCSEDCSRRGLVVLMRRSVLLKMVRSFEGIDTTLPTHCSIAELFLLCNQAKRDDHRIQLPWICSPEMTTPGLMLVLPGKPYGAGRGIILLPWHLNSIWSHAFSSPVGSCHARTDLHPTDMRLMDLNNDILMRIDSNLRPKDALSLRVTCHESVSSLPSLFDCSLSPLLLMSNTSEKVSLGLYSPVLAQAVLLTGIGSRIDLKGAELLSSHQEWVLLKCTSGLCVLNLLNNVTVEVPPPPKLCQHYDVLTLRVENYEHIQIFGVTTPSESTIFIGEYLNNNWVEYFFESNPNFVISEIANPVFLGNRHYCLGIDGTIGIFSNGNWETFRVADKTAYDLSFSHLTAVGGHLSVLLLGSRRSIVAVHDPLQGRFIEVPSLLDGSLFSGTKQTIPWAVQDVNFQDRIIRPMFVREPSTVTGFLEKWQEKWFLRSTESRGAFKIPDKSNIWASPYTAVNQMDNPFPYKSGPGKSLWIALAPDTRVLLI